MQPTRRILRANRASTSQAVRCGASLPLPSRIVLCRARVMTLTCKPHSRTVCMLRVPRRYICRRKWIHDMLALSAEIHDSTEGQHVRVCLRLCSWLYGHGQRWRRGCRRARPNGGRASLAGHLVPPVRCRKVQSHGRQRAVQGLHARNVGAGSAVLRFAVPRRRRGNASWTM